MTDTICDVTPIIMIMAWISARIFRNLFVISISRYGDTNGTNCHLDGERQCETWNNIVIIMFEFSHFLTVSPAHYFWCFEKCARARPHKSVPEPVLTNWMQTWQKLYSMCWMNPISTSATNQKTAPCKRAQYSRIDKQQLIIIYIIKLCDESKWWTRWVC